MSQQVRLNCLLMLQTKEGGAMKTRVISIDFANYLFPYVNFTAVATLTQSEVVLLNQEDYDKKLFKFMKKNRNRF